MKSAMWEGCQNWGRGPVTGRPTSVGPHDVNKDQTDPGNPGINPESCNLKPGNNNRVAEALRPGGTVTIKAKSHSEVGVVPETGRPRIGG